MLRISAGRMFRSACGAGFELGCSFTVVSHRIRLDISTCGHPRASQAHHKYQIEGRSLHVWTFSLPTSRRTDDAHGSLLLCPLIRRVSQWTKTSFSSRNFVLFLQYPVFSSMTRFAHCNRIFARSPHCNGAVSHALLCVLIAASSVQHAETLLVGLAPRCQDANATCTIPHVESTTEAVIGSMWKRALVNKLP